MECKKPRSMSLEEYKKWVSNPIARKASLPSFFPGGVNRTINVLEGDALFSSVKKRDSFLARHLASYCSNPTEKRRVAIRNWGFALAKSPREKRNL